MRNHRLVITTAIATLVAGALVFGGCQRHRSPEERIAHKLDHVADYLDLNDQQKMKLDEVKDELIQARKELRQDHQAIFDEVLVEVKGDQLDQAKLLQLIEQHQARFSEVAPPVIAKVAEFHATLTPEQKAKAVERLEKFRERMNHHGHGARM